MEHVFSALWSQPSRLVVGLMSGTSADGIDAVLTRIEGCGCATKIEQLGFYFLPFDSATRERILAVCGGEEGGSRELCLLSTHLGILYAQAVRELLKACGVEKVDLIGSHGQTVYHIPEPMDYVGTRIRGTLQIGDPSYLAEEFSCPVVSDFRIRDMAAGGLGAPLVPYTEFLLYRSESEDVALQNIGGIGNVTLLPAGCSLEEVTAFDTGPGNMVMDALAAKITGGKLTYDDGGKLAASGKVIPEMLEWMLTDPYLAKEPPKTTGREYFGKEYVEKLLCFGDYPLVDVLTTATAFTAESIALSLRRFAKKMPARLVVGGGGSRNPTLLRFMQEAMPECKVQTQEDLGLSSDAKEAVAFAILAGSLLQQSLGGVSIHLLQNHDDGSLGTVAAVFQYGGGGCVIAAGCVADDGNTAADQLLIGGLHIHHQVAVDLTQLDHGAGGQHIQHHLLGGALTDGLGIWNP